MKNPEQFLNQKIEITAPVIENSTLEQGEFKRWAFTLGEAGHRLAVYESGFNPLPIIKAHRLVEWTREAGEKVTITGKLKNSNPDWL